MIAEVVEYIVDDRVYTIVSSGYSNDPIKLGTEVGIKYNPHNPNDAIFALELSHYGGTIASIIFALSGAAITIISIKKMLDG